MICLAQVIPGGLFEQEHMFSAAYSHDSPYLTDNKIITVALCCPSLLSSPWRTAKRQQVAGWFGQYSFSLLCLAFVTVPLFAAGLEN
jgi:hypothetical protein